MDIKNVSTKKGWVTVDGNLVVAECKIPGLVGCGGRSVLLLALMSIARKDNEEGRIVTSVKICFRLVCAMSYLTGTVGY